MDELIGRDISHYRILRTLGIGGMGIVYLAKDLRLEREVAVKVLSPGAISDDSSRRRFRKEALALSRLNHPNVATVHDFDTQDGLDFLVMEYVGGETLAQKFESHRPSEEDIVRIALDLAAGLESAHEHGIVHRDLKPANVRLTPDGRLKILDFGLAKLLETAAAAESGEATQSVTETDGMPGTVPYMAPEQLRGEEITPRSDLWAAGALLYELATGGRAFPEPRGPALIRSILGKEPVPARSLRPDLSPAMDSVISRCLQKEPRDRYASAGDMASDLRKVQSGREVAPPRKSRRPRTALAVASLVATVVGIALTLLVTIKLQREGQTRIHSLAVLPLASFSTGDEDEYFADGMTDELITTLAQLGALKVISRSSTMKYKNTRETLPDIAKALHADAVLEGSVARSGDRIRITAQLVHAATDQHLWAQSYERDARDVLALQSDVARSIAREIHLTLTPRTRARLARARPVDPEAHAAYLRGLYAWNKRTVPWIQKAMAQFQLAISIDPEYAAPYAGIATCYSIMPAYYVSGARESLVKARAMALRALALDSTLAEPHAVLGGVKSELDYDQAGGLAEFHRAIELNPSYASGYHWYADQLSCLGRHDEALAAIEKAQELDPLSLIIATEAGGILARSGKIDEGIEKLKQTVAMDPGFARAHQTLGAVYRWAGRYPESMREFAIDDSLQGRSSADISAWYGPLWRAFHSGGGTAYLRQQLKQRYEAMRTGSRPVSPISMASGYAMLAERDSAFAWLDRSFEEHDPLVLRINVEPIWASLRADPRYAKLIRRIGLIAS